MTYLQVRTGIQCTKASQPTAQARCSVRPFSIMLAFFGKTSIFFSSFLEKELLAFSVISHDCDPDFSTQKGVFNPESLIQ